MFNHCHTFSEAVTLIREIDVTASAFFMLCGVRKGKAVVIEKGRNYCGTMGTLLGTMGTLLTSLTYSFILLVIALEMADVETPSCRAACANGSP